MGLDGLLLELLSRRSEGGKGKGSGLMNGCSTEIFSPLLPFQRTPPYAVPDRTTLLCPRFSLLPPRRRVSTRQRTGGRTSGLLCELLPSDEPFLLLFDQIEGRLVELALEACEVDVLPGGEGGRKVHRQAS